MPESFPIFAELVAKSFQSICTNQPLVVAVDGDALWQAYLAAFPPGTDPVFRKRSTHDCGTCRNFVKHAGGVVRISDGRLVTVWDDAAESAPEPYRQVAAAMRDLVAAADVADVFCVGAKEPQFGSRTTRSLEGAQAVTWDHFYTGKIERGVVERPDEYRGECRTTVQVFERGLKEFTLEAADTVLELIGSNNLYRGEEHLKAVQDFRVSKATYDSHGPRRQHLLVWGRAREPSCRFRTTVIGTLVQDLSEGADVEVAARAFEAKVAPSNYKRPTALVTPSMVKSAMATIRELGLEEALERRHATLRDVSVADVLWADGSARTRMKGGLEDALMGEALKACAPKTDGAVDVSVDEFLRMLPSLDSMEVLFESKHLGNLVTLTAPVHPEPRQLFKWDNDFAWSYTGNVADSIKERVKKAGGKVEGVALRVSLSWFNYDDLDLHVVEPSGFEISFMRKKSPSGGWLDVDMNVGSGASREAVENIAWKLLADGLYAVRVNQFRRRETVDGGFVVEVESGGEVSHYSLTRAVAQDETVEVVKLQVRGGKVVSAAVGPGIEGRNREQTKWGLRTGQFSRVSAVTLSPNYWGGCAIGNRHVIFALADAVCDEPARGIYNEFLHGRLEEHRKVLELVGEKTKCSPSPDQFSGLGFSTTKRDAVTVRVRTNNGSQRLYRIQVGG